MAYGLISYKKYPYEICKIKPDINVFKRSWGNPSSLLTCRVQWVTPEENHKESL